MTTSPFRKSYSPATVAVQESPVWQRMRGNLGREHFYVSLLGLKTFDVAGILACVSKGLSYSALEQVRQAANLPAAQFCDLVSIPPRTLARRKKAGRLEPDESDRLLRLARILGLALRLFEGNLESARQWLRSPQMALGGTAPIAYVRTDIGAREVENLIGRIEHGVPI